MAKYEKKYNFLEELNTNGAFDLSIYAKNFLKSLPTMVRIQVETLIETGDYGLEGTYLVNYKYKEDYVPVRATFTHTSVVPISPVDLEHIEIAPLILSDVPILSPLDHEEDDDDIPEIFDPELMPDIAPIPADDKYKECPYCHEKFLGDLEVHYNDVHTPTAYADGTPIEKPKQKRNKGRNMKGIEFEITDGEKFYKFVHPGGRIEFIPKDVREREMDELEGKHVNKKTDLEPVPESVQVIPTQKPDTSKYDVINPMIMVLNSFEKEQFRKWMKYQYNNTEAVVEERLSKLMLSTDQEYVMNQKIDLLEWYETDQKSRKEIENFDFFSDDKKDDTKKK